MALYFFYAFLAVGLLNFVCSVLLLRGLAEAGIKVRFFEIRWQVHKHMKTYRRVTTETTGKVAWPYYGYQASLAAMIGFGLLSLWFFGQ
jgi:hypothetical protein